WLKTHDIPGIAGVDTRALTARIRQQGMPHGVVAHSPSGEFDVADLREHLRKFPGLEGQDLAGQVTCRQAYDWRESPWTCAGGYGEQTRPEWRAVVLDYGVKRNILRQLAGHGAAITVLPAHANIADILRPDPQGALLA